MRHVRRVRLVPHLRLVRRPARAPARRAAAATESDDVFQFSGVEGRLEEKERERLSVIVFEQTGDDTSLEDARKALGALKRRSWERRYRAVRRQIEEAEKAGDRKGALQLLQAKMDLERERNKFGHASAVSET